MTAACSTLPTCSFPALRPYQQVAIDELLARIRAGRRAPLLVLPTGGGKRIILSAIVIRHIARDEAHKVLIVTHRRELNLQTTQGFRDAGVAVAELYPGGTTDAGARVFVASVQTLLARGDLPAGITLLVFDEAHHYSADEWFVVTTAYPEAIRLGFTATPCRADGRGLSPAFDSLVVGATIKQLIELGYLVRCKVIAPEQPLRGRELVQSPVDAYVEHAAGRRTIVFCEFVADAETFAKEFRSRGIEAVVVHGGLSSDERGEALRAHREDGAVLLNVAVLTEGWDSPETAVCILVRGCGSVGTYLQIAGRILRPAAGKTEALLVDLTGRAFFAHGPVDEEREFSLIGTAIRTKGRNAGVTCFVCGSLVDGWPCGVCGHQPEGFAAEPLKIVGGTLAERFVEKRAEDAITRVNTLARWIAEARARGLKEWSAVRKYEAVYGRKACQSYVIEARILSKDLSCSDCTSCGRATAKTYRGGQCGKCAFARGAA